MEHPYIILFSKKYQKLFKVRLQAKPFSSSQNFPLRFKFFPSEKPALPPFTLKRKENILYIYSLLEQSDKREQRGLILERPDKGGANVKKSGVGKE